MLRVSARALRLVRRFSSEAEARANAKKPTFFNPYQAEDSMTELLKRESPLLELSKGKVEREPFLLNLFVDKFDVRFLTYPEVLDNEKMDRLNALYERLRTYLDLLKHRDVKNGPTKEVIDEFKAMRLFGLGIPEEYGGLGFLDTEILRVLEAFSLHPSLGALMMAHNSSGVHALVNYGSEALKRQYLPSLASGETTAAFAMTEADSGSDLSGMKTRALVFEGEDHFEISGKKIFITNGENAEILTVACNLDKIETKEHKIKAISVLLIDRRWPGVKVKKVEGLLGLQGAGIAEVEFDKVQVPKDHLIGMRGEGFKIVMESQAKTRMCLSALSVGIARDALNRTIDYTLKNKRQSKPLIEHEDAKYHISEMAGQVLGMESALYMTAAISDVVLNPNYDLESAATKLIATEYTKNILEKALRITGVKFATDDSLETRWYLDHLMLESYEAPPFINYMLLAMNGLKKTATANSDLINILNDPFDRPLAYLKNVRQIARYRSDVPAEVGNLEQFLHPSLRMQANILELAVRRMTFAGMALVHLEGKQGLEKQYKLNILGKMACEVYMNSALLARASRSYCIGLRNSFQEIKLAYVIAEESQRRIASYVDWLDKEYGATELHLKIDLSEEFAEYKGYGIEHPLKKNWR